MFTHILVTIHRSILASLVLAAFVVASMTSAGFGQIEVANNPLYQGQSIAAGAVIMANHDFEA